MGRSSTVPTRSRSTAARSRPPPTSAATACPARWSPCSPCSRPRPSPRPCPSSDAVSSVIGSRRSYVGARSPLRRRLQAPSVPVPESRYPLSRAIALAVLATAFASRGGSELERTTWTEVGIMLLGAALCAAALLLPRSERTPARYRGAVALGGFRALAVLHALR